MALVIAGRVVPCDKNDPDAVFAGRVFVDNDGNIEHVGKDNTPAPAGFAAAPVIDAGNNFIVPGLIDLHNHIGYNTLPLLILFFWPIRASSANQISIVSMPTAFSRAIASRRAGKLF